VRSTELTLGVNQIAIHNLLGASPGPNCSSHDAASLRLLRLGVDCECQGGAVPCAGSEAAAPQSGDDGACSSADVIDVWLPAGSAHGLEGGSGEWCPEGAQPVPAYELFAPEEGPGGGADPAGSCSPGRPPGGDASPGVLAYPLQLPLRRLPAAGAVASPSLADGSARYLIAASDDGTMRWVPHDAQAGAGCQPQQDSQIPAAAVVGKPWALLWLGRLAFSAVAAVGWAAVMRRLMSRRVGPRGTRGHAPP
jgi:hypothetical protein